MRLFEELCSRINARIRRELIYRLGIGKSGITSLFFGEKKSAISWTRKDLFSNLLNIEAIHPRNEIEEGHTFQSRYLVTVNDIYLDLLTGIVTSNENAILSESSSWPPESLLLNAVPRPPTRSTPLDLSQGRPVIAIPSNGFYHWLIEDLAPFLFALRKLENPIILANQNCPSYVENLLKLLPNEVVKSSRFVHLESYTFATKGQDTGWPHPVDIATLRDFFQLSISATVPGKKVYISRLSVTRSPAFEQKLQDTLEKSGWLILHTEKMTLEEQIAEISSAEILCGVHGAGLSGMIWMQKGSQVIELGVPRFVPCFARMSAACSHSYLRIEYERDDDETLDSIRAEISGAIANRKGASPQAEH